MNFTTRKPARYVDDQALVRAIHQAADLGTVKHVDTRRFVESEELVISDLLRLQACAEVVKGDSVDGVDQVCSWMFEDDALDFIKAKCRNRYWLWRLMQKLKTTTFPINIIALARAHARVKDQIEDKRYGFNWTTPGALIYTLKGLPPGFVFQIWEDGKLLAIRDYSGEGLGIVLNPLLIDD